MKKSLSMLFAAITLMALSGCAVQGGPDLNQSNPGYSDTEYGAD
jgi:hypothetical protein